MAGRHGGKTWWEDMVGKHGGKIWWEDMEGWKVRGHRNAQERGGRKHSLQSKFWKDKEQPNVPYKEEEYLEHKFASDRVM